jgi:NAD(P)-dependent dehydrogenase (short-subunit alcohol dehydrogenase family)
MRTDHNMIDLGLEGKRAIVAGAGYRPDRAGHGRASTLNLAAAGATVACIDQHEGRAQAIAAEVVDAGGKAFPVVGDIASVVGAQSAIDEAVQVLGGVDVVVDIVGGASWSTVLDASEEDWDWTLLHNLTQVKYVFQAALKHMVPQGTGGALISITSVDGINSAAFHASYGAAKAGLIHLTKTFAEELGRYGIRVNSVAPGNVGVGVWDAPDTAYGSNPVNPLAPPRPQDIGDGVLFLASRLAQRVTGQTLIVDGGVGVRSPWGFRPEEVAMLREHQVPGGQAWEEPAAWRPSA